MCNALQCVANYSNENIAQKSVWVKYRQLSPLFCIRFLPTPVPSPTYFISTSESESLKLRMCPSAQFAQFDIEELGTKVKSMMTVSENRIGKEQKKGRICMVCGKEGSLNTIINHIEANKPLD